MLDEFPGRSLKPWLWDDENLEELFLDVVIICIKCLFGLSQYVKLFTPNPFKFFSKGSKENVKRRKELENDWLKCLPIAAFPFQFVQNKSVLI